jgi:hypothetical protein
MLDHDKNLPNDLHWFDNTFDHIFIINIKLVSDPTHKNTINSNKTQYTHLHVGFRLALSLLSFVVLDVSLITLIFSFTATQTNKKDETKKKRKRKKKIINNNNNDKESIIETNLCQHLQKFQHHYSLHYQIHVQSIFEAKQNTVTKNRY